MLNTIWLSVSSNLDVGFKKRVNLHFLTNLVYFKNYDYFFLTVILKQQNAFLSYDFVTFTTNFSLSVLMFCQRQDNKTAKEKNSHPKIKFLNFFI